MVFFFYRRRDKEIEALARGSAVAGVLAVLQYTISRPFSCARSAPEPTSINDRATGGLRNSAIVTSGALGSHSIPLAGS